MDQQNQGSASSIQNKRKRGRPRRDEEGETQQQQVTTTTDDDSLIGQVVSGVVEGSFEAGYFLNVKVVDTDKQLKGLVFLPDRVNPVTPTTDLFPQAKMYAREDIPIPSFNQQTPPQGNKDNGNQSTMVHDGVGSEAVDEMNDPVDTEMKDVGGSSAEEKLTEPEGQTLSLMPQFASDDALKDDHTAVLRSDSEACGETTETNRKQDRGTSSTLSLELFQNETKRSGTEDEKTSAETVDDVPEELQLELGNKKMSASAIASPDRSASSKGGFLANLFERREETEKEAEESNAGLESGLPEATRQVDGNES
ncbi:unnamed protein product [Microthlaspi erraticum]|uniref:Uncharacterized protein n=1 Tax=Microthlaspi erraticum TaxID=1685480 RepID=A0A6D2II70_9BRAS|nr:unnamed protein product [Microthlaspi erraticum]CAA7035365.1 unnamed protein product [Microthlaspi erraticum]